MIQLPEPSVLPGTWGRHGYFPRRPSLPTGRCWWPGDLVVLLFLPLPSYMIRGFPPNSPVPARRPVTTRLGLGSLALGQVRMGRFRLVFPGQIPALQTTVITPSLTTSPV